MNSFVPTFVPALVAAHQRRVLRKFQAAGAVRPGDARTPAEVDVPEDRFVRQLARAGVLVSPEPGRYFVSADGLARWERRRVVGAAVAVGVLVLGVTLALLMGAL